MINKSLPIIKIKPAHDRRIIAGNPWIFSNEIDNFNAIKNLEAGSLVLIDLPNLKNFAIGYFNPHSLIASRILSYDCTIKIDENFFIKIITEAQNFRNKFMANFDNKHFYRLINSCGDNLSGLIIDRYDNIFICQISTSGMEKLKKYIIEALLNLYPNAKIIFKNNSELRYLEKLNQDTLIENINFNEIPSNIKVLENDNEFLIDPINGQKTGWFFDQRANRKFITTIAKDANILDAYCYVGGFGVNAIKAQAKSVTFVDSSYDALELTKKNSANAIQKFNKNCDVNFYNEKVFDLFEKNILPKQSFDIIMLDPPAFIKNKKDFFAGIKGYEKLIKNAIPYIKSNGFIMLTSCSHHATQHDLVMAVQHAFNKSKKSAKLIRNFGADIDHPIHPAIKENEYLKSLTFYIN